MTDNVSVRWYGEEVKAITRAANVRALKLSAEYLLEAANRGVPIEESTLEKSGKVSVDEAALIAAVSYDTPYARRQHEDLTLHHAAGRCAKWLQKALDEQTTRIREVFAGVLKGIW
jgi:hypothetical protein